MKPLVRTQRLGLAALLASMLLPSVVAAETVIARRRLGNNTEGMTYDPRRDRAVAIDGNDVIAISLRDAGDDDEDRDRGAGPDAIAGLGFRKIFDVLNLDPLARGARGLVFVPPQRRFYFSSSSPQGSTQFFSADEHGAARPTLNLSGLAANLAQWEGLAWIPEGAPFHSGTIAGLGIVASEGLAHVFYLRLDGTVEAEVVPQPGTPLENYLCAIQYWPAHRGTLLISDCGATGVYAMDMQTGSLIGDPNKPLLVLPEAGDVESIVVRRDGQILLNGYETGRLFAFDADLRRTPGQDRLFVVGLGVSAARLGWNFDSGELITATATSAHLFAIAPDLRAARLMFDAATDNEVDIIGNGGIAYLGNGQLAIGNRFFPRGVDIADAGSGHSLSRLLFFQPVYPGGRAFQVLGVGAYGSDKLLIRTPADRNALKVVSRSGTSDTSLFLDGVRPPRFPDIALSSPARGVDAQLFDAGAGPRLFTGAEIYDGSGTLLHTIDQAALGLTEGISSGVWMSGNTFAAEDGQTSTVIIYTVP
jgi:hypothetical protein